jgi:two-component system sensor histidine kinase AlgZ
MNRNRKRKRKKMNIGKLKIKKQYTEDVERKDNVFVHILVWCVVFGLPPFFALRGGFFSWPDFFSFLPIPISFLIIFYVNYFYLTERWLFKRKILLFITINIGLIVGLALLLHVWHEMEQLFVFSSTKPKQSGETQMPEIAFIVRDISSLTFVTILSIAIKITMRLSQMEARQKEMEKAMTEAELKNLKNQINPHFLLNTLNNIYALSQFDPPKSTSAILELSELLRYVLYDNEKKYVPLQDEIDFIRNYIELMQLRLTDNTKVAVNFDISEDNNTLIAPLIFISLIENAFKHGISNDEPSMIEFKLKENPNGEILFYAKNSYFPKTISDKSGSGIGLQQVKKRLELLYPHRYVWKTEIKDNYYTTILIINTLNTGDDES